MLQTFNVRVHRSVNESASVTVEADDFGDAWTKAFAMVETDPDSLEWTMDGATTPPEVVVVTAANDGYVLTPAK